MFYAVFAIFAASEWIWLWPTFKGDEMKGRHIYGIGGVVCMAFYAHFRGICAFYARCIVPHHKTIANFAPEKEKR